MKSAACKNRTAGTHCTITLQNVISSHYTVEQVDIVSVSDVLEICVSMFQYFTYHQRLKVWNGLGDKIEGLFYCTVHPPTSGQLGFQLVGNLPISPVEGWRHAPAMENQRINVM